MTWIFHILSIRVHDLAIPSNLTKFLKINPIIQSFPISKLPISPEERHKMGSLCTITNWSRLSLLLSDFCLSLLKILLLYPKFLFKVFFYIFHRYQAGLFFPPLILWRSSCFYWGNLTWATSIFIHIRMIWILLLCSFCLQEIDFEDISPNIQG